jgi:hypothetical protein
MHNVLPVILFPLIPLLPTIGVALVNRKGSE